MTKYDDLWTNTTAYADYANVAATARAPLSDVHEGPAAQFPAARVVREPRGRPLQPGDAEDRRDHVPDHGPPAHRRDHRRQGSRHPGSARSATRSSTASRSRPWVSWNIDRLYMAGVQIKMRAHQGLNHQKLVLLYGQMLSIFGSSNWTSPSDNSQEEHNCFCTDATMFQWFTDMFERKWNNTRGRDREHRLRPAAARQAGDPRARPTTPRARPPRSRSSGTADRGRTSTTCYLGTTTTPPLVAADVELGPSQSAGQMQSVHAAGGADARNDLLLARRGEDDGQPVEDERPLELHDRPGAPHRRLPSGSAGVGDIVLYAAEAPVKTGTWTVVADASAAGGTRLANPNLNAAKVTTASATPANYFEMTFTAEAGKAVSAVDARQGERATATPNDSVFVQFSDSVTAGGAAQWRIGTTSAAEVNLENCSGCGAGGMGLAGHRVRQRRRRALPSTLRRPASTRCACRSARTASRSIRSCSRRDLSSQYRLVR